MQDNDFRPSTTSRTGVLCRFRNGPRLLGVGLLVVPVAAAVGAFGLLPSTAAAASPAPQAQVRLAASGHGPATSTGTDDSRRGAQHADRKRDGSSHGDRHEKGHDKGHKKGKDRLTRIPAETALLAWFDAGYLAEDAEELAAIWHRDSADLHDVKVLAGRKLVAGRDLPVDPSGTPATEEEIAQREQLDAFLDAGYDADDADLLARYWNIDSLEAKYLTGAKLLAGGEVPVGPEETAWSVPDDVARQAFFNNGFGYEDAVVLADLWSIDSWDAKANAGHKLLDGLPLPVGPADGPTADDRALDAYFAAGYGYEDAEVLAALWSLDVFDAKVTAGHKLLAGLTLPLGH